MSFFFFFYLFTDFFFFIPFFFFIFSFIHSLILEMIKIISRLCYGSSLETSRAKGTRPQRVCNRKEIFNCDKFLSGKPRNCFCKGIIKYRKSNFYKKKKQKKEAQNRWFNPHRDKRGRCNNAQGECSKHYYRLWADSRSFIHRVTHIATMQKLTYISRICADITCISAKNFNVHHVYPYPAKFQMCTLTSTDRRRKKRIQVLILIFFYRLYLYS